MHKARIPADAQRVRTQSPAAVAKPNIGKTLQAGIKPGPLQFISKGPSVADEQKEDPEIKEVLHSIDDKLGELVNPSPIATYPKKPEDKKPERKPDGN